jgi:hypothetical protein
MYLYILAEDGKTPVATDSMILWGRTQADIERRTVAKSRDEERGIAVSTVFLGINHNFGDGPPILFETMIFDGKSSDRQWRYATWEEAERGHKVACGIAGIAWSNFDKGSMSA